MGEHADALGLGKTLEHEGKVYTFSPCDQTLKGRFEVWMEGRAWKRNERQAQHLSPVEHERRRQQLSRDIDSGVYSWESEVWAQAVNTVEGRVQLLKLSLEAAHPRITDEEVAKLYGTRRDDCNEILHWLADPPNSQPRPAQSGDPAEK